MEYIQWQPAFDLGDETIDSQHRELVRILNETYEMMLSYARLPLFLGKIAELKSYVVEHFTYEEKLMESIAYPKLISHRKLHREFVKELIELEGKIRKGKKSASAEVFIFLRDWLIEHIQVQDRGYSALLT
ncbi:MAG: hemerythrin family protein [Spirochaetales bacterium]|nr:hemerythrin family protein [Spirochaetales bacterium]